MRRAWDKPAEGADCVQFIYDGHRQDRDCTDSVDVEKLAGNVTQLSLADVNRSISQGQMLMSGSDGGLVLSPSRVRVMCRDRLRRVAVGCKGRREVFETGTVVVREDAGQLAVIGALPPDVTLHPDKESGSETSATAGAQTARTDASEPAAARLSPPVGRPPPTLLRCDGVPVRRPSGGGGGDGPDLAAAPALVDLTTPEKAPSPRPAEAEAAPARRRLKLPLEVTLLNESDMSDDELDDLGELAVSAAPEKKSDDVYCPNIELIEL
ncbi:hypothetical protein FJT64_017803 [Amphibalanus amphitrite]|uniref:Uncharacterized protein n=1 Tax=Amphibalanus amphitrite TaxID=1232801 RepID=A0A6A4X8H8_AMPAM|nr:hypothetical protein FJT64_017803 [Amphibalanus amphitrite]